MALNRAAIRRQHRHTDYRSIQRHSIVVLADNLDKASNLGGILRTAEAFLVEKVATDREMADAAGAMGAEHWQPVEWNVDLLQTAMAYRDRGYGVVALEQTPEAIAIHEFRFRARTVLAVGAEVFGVSQTLIDVADHVVFIPQAGLVKSLNVVTATSIALYEYSRQTWMPGFDQSARHLVPSTDSARIKTSYGHGHGRSPSGNRRG